MFEPKHLIAGFNGKKWEALYIGDDAQAGEEVWKNRHKAGVIRAVRYRSGQLVGRWNETAVLSVVNNKSAKKRKPKTPKAKEVKKESQEETQLPEGSENLEGEKGNPGEAGLPEEGQETE